LGSLENFETSRALVFAFNELFNNEAATESAKREKAQRKPNDRKLRPRPAKEMAVFG
jgi:hypothetical protein